MSKIALTRNHASYDRRLEMLLLLPHVAAQMNRETWKSGIVLVDLQWRTEKWFIASNKFTVIRLLNEGISFNFSVEFI